MENTGWWSREIESELTQGDVVSTLSIAVLNEPIRYLKKTNTHANGQVNWSELNTPSPDKQGITHYLAKGNDLMGIIVSHSCDMDKTAKRILIAPIAPLENIQLAHRDTIINQTNIRLFGMENLPGVGDVYADLRNITSVPVSVVKSLTRVASMSPKAQLLLQARLYYFFTRVKL